MAALIKEQLGFDTELIVGNRGEFTVWVGGEKVAQKTSDGFPSDGDAVAAVRKAVGR